MSTPEKEAENTASDASANKNDVPTDANRNGEVTASIEETVQQSDKEKTGQNPISSFISGGASDTEADAADAEISLPSGAKSNSVELGPKVDDQVSWPDANKLDQNSQSETERSNSSDAETDDSAGYGNPLPDNSPPLTQIHVSHLLSEVLQEPQPEPSAVVRKVRIPIIFDVVLAGGLLFAVGGFTFGLFHMYLVHSAAQAISEQKYKAAIAILKGAPFPKIFSRPGSDTEEMLSKATYLDAMDRLESENDVAGAVKQLEEIKAGSKYFHLAQEAINENTEPATMMLQGGTEHNESSPPPEEQQSLLDKTLKEEEK
jgi:hypothetical protein